MIPPRRPRHIELTGCVNLRDVGGYPTRGGRTLACGRLFRGGAPSATAAVHLIGTIGIRRVIDLRTSRELREQGELSMPPTCERIHLPLFASERPHWVNPTDRTPRAVASRYLEMLEDGVSSLPRILALLSETPALPTLIHCAAGRDRTGIVIGCVLDLLDVPDEVIAADYALSQVVDDEEGRRARPQNIRGLLELLREKYGSTRDMVVGWGLPSGGIDRLREALLD